MRAVGASTVGFGAVGTASASGKGKKKYREKRGLKYRFFGCSQVCVNKKHVKAVIAKKNGECYTKKITRKSKRGNLWKKGKIYCLEVKGENKAVVGIKYDGKFLKNRNRCAKNYECAKPHK